MFWHINGIHVIDEVVLLPFLSRRIFILCTTKGEKDFSYGRKIIQFLPHYFSLESDLFDLAKSDKKKIKILIIYIIIWVFSLSRNSHNEALGVNDVSAGNYLVCSCKSFLNMIYHLVCQLIPF